MDGKNRGKRKKTGILLLDLTAAYDTLDMELLCEKLKLYGFCGNNQKMVQIIFHRKNLEGKNWNENVRGSWELGWTWSAPGRHFITGTVYSIHIRHGGLGTKFRSIRLCRRHKYRYQ
jgi:hypothetical protein